MYQLPQSLPILIKVFCLGTKIQLTVRYCEIDVDHGKEVFWWVQVHSAHLWAPSPPIEEHCLQSPAPPILWEDMHANMQANTLSDSAGTGRFDQNWMQGWYWGYYGTLDHCSVWSQNDTDHHCLALDRSSSYQWSRVVQEKDSNHITDTEQQEEIHQQTAAWSSKITPSTTSKGSHNCSAAVAGQCFGALQ